MTSTYSHSKKSCRSALSRSAIGERAEELVCSYLRLSHYRIIQCNYRPRYLKKELDIVAVNLRNSHLSFIEVKSSLTAGFIASENITHRKIRHLQVAIAGYLAQHDWQGNYQLEFISLTGSGMRTYRLEHLVADMV